MRVVPVLDVMQGEVVRGIAGDRDHYRPIQSQIVSGSAPVEVARAFLRRGYEQLYLADLDAIRGAVPDVMLYQRLMGLGAKLWIDAGTGTVEAAAKVVGCDNTSVVIGLESVASPLHLRQIAAELPGDRLLFSLDMKYGSVVAGGPDWSGMSAVDCAMAAIASGVRQLIVLDVAAVGIDSGVPTLELCRTLRGTAPDIVLISGGGIRSREDIAALEAAGCDAALVASALHDGRL